MVRCSDSRTITVHPLLGGFKRKLIMKIRTVLMAIVATSALSGAAFAGGSPHMNGQNHPSDREEMSAQCSTLESQYNSIIEGKMSSAKVEKAEGLHAQGVNACQSTNSDIGVQKLQQAVRDLGVKPAA
jgi:hypothetical protein